MKRLLPVILTVLILVLLASWAIRRTTNEISSQVVFQHEPRGIMGTVSNLVLVTDRDRARAAQEQLETAESELRRLESLMSTWIDSSQISRFNSAPADQPIALADELVEVLTMAGELYERTNGVFDITIRPLIELWRQAGDRNSVPSQADLETARAASGWDQIRFTTEGVSKKLSSTSFDVDGIAKGFAIDRALEVLQGAGAAGGMVEVGGDLRVFGEGPGGRRWTVAIRSPFEDRVWAELELAKGAVCTSGDYARFVEIDGRRLGHIIDPRHGWPAEPTYAVTVVGPDAATADAWATALSIMGVAGLDRLGAEEGLEAMVVSGGPDDFKVQATAGFRQLVVRAAFEISD